MTAPAVRHEANRLADLPYIDGEGLIDVLSAVVRLALHDLAVGYTDKRFMSAAAFLESCGLWNPETQAVDLHGHQVVYRTYFGRDER